jgi:hypothetical protein
MKNRRAFLLTLSAGAMALAVIVAPVIADELFGVITKVDVAGKKLTVEEKESGKEIEITTTDDTEVITGKGAMKIDLEKLEKQVAKIQEKGKKGINAEITHEKKVASKIKYQFKKKAAQQEE